MLLSHYKVIVVTEIRITKFEGNIVLFLKQSLTDPTAMVTAGILHVLSTFGPISEVLVPDNALTDHLSSLMLKKYVNMNKRTFGSH